MIDVISPNDPLFLLGVAFAAASLTRGVGVAISGQVEADTQIFHWFACVGQAIVGGLMVRAVLFSTLLNDTLMLDRILAVSFALAMFFFFGRRLLLSSLAGVVTLAILCVWRDL